MCGIAGLLHFDKGRKVDKAVLRRMTNVLSHRGPDGEGYYIADHIGLGHRRLAVIDLSTGAQPMISRDENLVIVFNGEIYNYVELRDELRALGHTFTTSSDTEVILKAYEQWGFECQKKFNGVWAFAIWDSRGKYLLLSRDRIGEKPLHYSLRDGSLLFGSEIKSILASGFTYESANHLLHIYLSLGYVPAPYTFYNGIAKLMPGHFLVVKDGKVDDKIYWDLPEIGERDMRTDASRIYEEFEEYFSHSVKIRMRCDVPYGAFLSGGLDSSTVVAAMFKESPSAVETFTMGFGEKAFDERELARQVALHFQTNHHEHLVRPEVFDEALQRVLFHFDEPFGDASATLIGLMSRLAREKVTVVLTGDGGDEVLSGYPRYVAEKMGGAYRKIPPFIRAGLYRVAAMAALVTRKDMRYRVDRLTRFLHFSGMSFEERLIAQFSSVSPAMISRLILHSGPQISIEEYLSDVFGKCNFKDPFYRLMYFHLKVSLPDDMLAKVDRMSMAHSLEARVPFLDHRIIELTYCVDKSVKLPKYEPKHLLRKTYGDKLPRAVLSAPKKSFRVPLREWFMQEEFEGRLRDLASGDFGLDPAAVQEFVTTSRSGRHDYGDFIWRLFVLKHWHDKSA